MINGVHHVGLSTGDLDRLQRFYADLLGFRVLTSFEWPEGSADIDRIIGLKNSAARHVMLARDRFCMEIFEYHRPTPKSTAPLLPNDRGYTHICIDVSDIDAEYERLRAAGMEFNCAPPKSEGQAFRSTYGRDPDGNIIELQELFGVHPWRQAPAAELPAR